MTVSDPSTWEGAPVLGGHGELLGHVDTIVFTETTGRATWVAVLGAQHTAMVPLDHAGHDGQMLHVPYSAEQLLGAPRHDPAQPLSPQDEQDLHRHYGVLSTLPVASTGPDTEPGHPTAPGDSPGVTPAGWTVWSEEQLRAGVQRRPFARVRLVRYIVTENITYTVPVRREEVRLEQVPLDEGDNSDRLADDHPGLLAEDVHEVVLHREEVLFTTHTVPVERVGMVCRVVTEPQHISGQVQAEHFAVEHTHTGDEQTGQDPAATTARTAGGPAPSRARRPTATRPSPRSGTAQTFLVPGGDHGQSSASSVC